MSRFNSNAPSHDTEENVINFENSDDNLSHDDIIDENNQRSIRSLRENLALGERSNTIPLGYSTKWRLY